MSSADSSKAVAKRPAPGSLMAPPPAPKRIKRPQIVLDEDTYTSSIAHIIRRDFFPGLAETDAQHEYLDALKSNNNTWIQEAGDKLKVAMTPLPAGQRRRKAPSATPKPSGAETPRGWVGDTPVTLADTDLDDQEEEEDKKPDVDLNMSLSAFQAKYISEDQESFSQLLDRQNAKKFRDTAWLRQGNRYASKQRLAQQKVLDSKPESKDGSSSTELVLVPRLSQDLDARPAAPNPHKHTPFNALMFAPDSIEDWAPTRAQRAETASLAPPKAVLHHNTRLPVPDPAAEYEYQRPRPASPTLSAVRDAISGQPRHTRSELDFGGNETPRVNGYAFVDATPPSPLSPHTAPRDLLERFEVKSDPSPFTIHDSDMREKMHYKMVDRINAQRSAKDHPPQGPSETSVALLPSETPRFLTAPKMTPHPGMRMGTTPGRKDLGNLTPAAQRLFAKAGGTPRVGVGEGGFGGGGAGRGREWTPTPKVRRRA
ncbi:nuclear protein DGCR14 [Lophiotrema nucula]|uniref:Nuclear protein DGCR14 n=1 Tax=Lophiotrema nucula TaxID=690887 RepID=A0A6A5ZI24_9PLEO|nr:nuclear protein DGCR14 [Lophiotrema nucula]